MTTRNWGWLALAAMILIVGGTFLDLNSNSLAQRARLETTTRMNPSPQTPSRETVSPGSFAAPLQPGQPAAQTARDFEEVPDARDPMEEARTPNRLYRDARIQPVYDLATNRVEGVRIVDVVPDSFWSEIGVRSHDVILEFNGHVIETPSATVALMNAVSAGHSLSLRIRSAEGKIRFADYRTPR